MLAAVSLVPPLVVPSLSGPEACGSPLVGGAGSRPSAGQGCVEGCEVLEGIWHTWGHTARSQVKGVCRPGVLPLSGLRVECLGFHRCTLSCILLALL